MWALDSIIAFFALAAGVVGQDERPNIIVIVVDDQDFHMGSLPYMTEVSEHLVSAGTLFEKHYCTIAICCPSRVDLWTGQMSHNTNVTNVQPPWGGYPKFIANGYNDHHLALWMQESGYNTYYAGKLFNGHSVENYNSPHMSGYTGSDFFLEPYAYDYYNTTTTRNGGPPTNHLGEYSTDLVSQDAQEFLDNALSEEERTPFFITLAPVAPHGYIKQHPTRTGPPIPAERHEGLFQDYTIPRTANFNPDEPSSVNWIANLQKMNDTVLDYNDEYQRLRMRSLMAVDELVGDLITRLEDEGILDQTYIFYTSDNGFHIGQHRLHPGKMCGLETDINVPMIVRGPGVPAGARRNDPSSHTDVAPTIMRLAGNSIDDRQFDGAPIDLGPLKDGAIFRSEHVAVEFWGIGLGESIYANPDATGPLEYANNTYKGLRIVGEDYGFYYSVWCNNEKELYEMKNDPGQLTNLLAIPSPDPDFSLFDRDLSILASRLDALMLVLKVCREADCVDPWGALHPGGAVKSLEDALATDYDAFYEEQNKVFFDRCERGYFLEAEGPLEWNTFGAESVVIDPRWSEYV